MRFGANGQQPSQQPSCGSSSWRRSASISRNRSHPPNVTRLDGCVAEHGSRQVGANLRNGLQALWREKPAHPTEWLGQWLVANSGFDKHSNLGNVVATSATEILLCLSVKDDKVFCGYRGGVVKIWDATTSKWADTIMSNHVCGAYSILVEGNGLSCLGDRSAIRQSALRCREQLLCRRGRQRRHQAVGTEGWEGGALRHVRGPLEQCILFADLRRCSLQRIRRLHGQGARSVERLH